MNPNITKLIDQYLSGELGAEDRQAFEAKMAEHPDLQKEVALQQSVYDAAKRSVVRQQVRKTGKRYHLGRWLKVVGLGLGVVIVAVAATVYGTSIEDRNTTEEDHVPGGFQEQLDEHLQLDQLDAQYFNISALGEVVLSEDGVLLSVPRHAFLKDGKPYDGESIIQFQEALKGGDIVKAGLSTMSGDRLLETQGMMALQAYTSEGELLDFNPEVGVYVQVPVDEYKSEMQLFDGIKKSDGTIDWQNPVPLEKIPVPVDMTELNFYPEGYEDFLDEQKWKRSKKSRDSLYLSFEQFGRVEREAVKITPIPKSVLIADSVYNTYDSYSIVGMPQPYIFPSKVLGFWNKKFNQTNLATREFERRMRLIHTTCSNAVLEKYTEHLGRPLSAIDAEVAAMGYPDFEAFASEQVGKVTVSNAHLEQLKVFYSNGVNRLKNQAKKDSEKEKNRRKTMDDHMTEERLKEGERTVNRNARNVSEEFAFNLENVYRQLGRTVGFTLGTGGGQASAIKNIDRYVMEATVARKSTKITDPETGKTATITYNNFQFEVPQANKYLKLYAYLFPHQLNSYQRINGNNGRFVYPLNNDIIYDLAVVGLTKDGFEYYQKQTFKSGELGQINMQPIGETKLEASIQQLNAGRISKSMAIGDELQWLFTERGYYKELQQRMEMAVFREQVACVLFPCYEGGQMDDSSTAKDREK